MRYEEAENLLRTARNREKGKPIDHNTRLFDRDDYIAIRLHNTDIVKIFPNDDNQLFTGGWQTVTTKDRLNKFTVARIWQEKGVWYMDRETIFKEGCTVHPDGSVSDAGSRRELLKQQALRKRAKAYAKKFIDKLYAGKIPAPAAGDCWFCAMRTQEGIPLGEATKNSDHIHAHLDEMYFVPSLLWRAVEVFGSRAELHEIGHYMQMHEQGPFVASGDWMKQSLVRHLRRYLYQELGLPR